MKCSKFSTQVCSKIWICYHELYCQYITAAVASILSLSGAKCRLAAINTSCHTAQPLAGKYTRLSYVILGWVAKEVRQHVQRIKTVLFFPPSKKQLRLLNSYNFETEQQLVASLVPGGLKGVSLSDSIEADEVLNRRRRGQIIHNILYNWGVTVTNTQRREQLVIHRGGNSY